MIMQIVFVFLILLGVFIIGFHVGQNSMLKLFRETMPTAQKIEFIKHLQERLMVLEREEK